MCTRYPQVPDLILSFLSEGIAKECKFFLCNISFCLGKCFEQFFDTLNLDCTRAYIFKNSSNLRIIYGRSLWIYFTVIDVKYSSVTTSLLSFSNWFNDSLTIIPTGM